MNNKLIITLIIIAIAIIAAITNPDKERHTEVVKSKVIASMQKALHEDANAKQEDAVVGEALGLMIGGFLIDQFLESNLSVENYIFLSITKLTWQGESRTIGIGAFGNVFITPEFDKAINDGLLKN
jgi:hypothetical protein